MAGYDHGCMSCSMLQSSWYGPAGQQSIDECTAVRISSAKRFQELNVIGLYLLGFLISGIGNRALLAMLDDDDPVAFSNILLSQNMVCR